MNSSNEPKYIRPKEVRVMLGGISAATLWRYTTQTDDFPKPIKLTKNGRAVAYNAKELEDYLNSKCLERHNG